MTELQTEEEQVEAIKKWWKENGKSIIAGVVIGLGGVFSWQFWGDYQDRVGREASVSFAQMLDQVHQGNLDAASQQAELIRVEYESNSFAVLAALVQARLKLEQGDSAAARSQLEWAMNNSPNSGLEKLARLNLARILLSEGDTEAAAKLVTVETGGYAASFAELRGDIASAQQDKDAALDAYQQALALGTSAGQRVQIKLDDLSSAQ